MGYFPSHIHNVTPLFPRSPSPSSLTPSLHSSYVSLPLTKSHLLTPHPLQKYLQNIRNNTGRGRTPRWAIEHGLIEPDKVQSLQWQHRYAERTHENIYENDEAASIHSAGSNRDTYASMDVAAGGEGPRRAAGGGAGGGGGRKKKGGIEEARRNRYAGGSPAAAYGTGNSKGDFGARDLERRETDDSLRRTSSRHSFTAAPTTSEFDSQNDVVGGRSGGAKKKGGFMGLFGGKTKKDRFEVEREVRGDSGYGTAPQEYGDEFEREINGGAARETVSTPPIRAIDHLEGERDDGARPSRGSGRDGLDHTF